MPYCTQCQKSFPNRAWVDGKFKTLHTRKYCLECSPPGTRKKCGPKPDPQSKLHITSNGRKIYVKEKYCLICQKAYNQKTTNSACGTCRSLLQRNKKKEQLVKMKGGKCQVCGYSKSIKALVFHHRDPKEKRFSISSRLDKKLETLIKEIQKCDLLCANCHAELHAAEHTI